MSPITENRQVIVTNWQIVKMWNNSLLKSAGKRLAMAEVIIGKTDGEEQRWPCPQMQPVHIRSAALVMCDMRALSGK